MDRHWHNSTYTDNTPESAHTQTTDTIGVWEWAWRVWNSLVLANLLGYGWVWGLERLVVCWSLSGTLKASWVSGYSVEHLLCMEALLHRVVILSLITHKSARPRTQIWIPSFLQLQVTHSIESDFSCSFSKFIRTADKFGAHSREVRNNLVLALPG